MPTIFQEPFFLHFWWNTVLENDVRKWNVNTSATQSQCFGKFSGNQNFVSFIFFFFFFLSCYIFLKRVLRKSGFEYRGIGKRQTDYGIISMYSAPFFFFFYNLINVKYLRRENFGINRWGEKAYSHKHTIISIKNFENKNTRNNNRQQF